MSWTPQKRFWTDVAVTEAEGGFAVALDGRPLRTPAKAALVLPNRPLAEAIAAEWDAQEGDLRPDLMPLTKAGNSAIDKVVPNHAAVVDMVAGYGGTDLLCYREPHVAALIARQRDAWDPWLDWAAERYGVRLSLVAGVMHADQPQAALEVLRSEVAGFAPFALTGLHDLVTLSGSLILGLAVAEGALAADQAWEVSRLDELWQEEAWGTDDEAQALSDQRRAAFLTAAQILDLLEGTRA